MVRSPTPARRMGRWSAHAATRPRRTGQARPAVGPPCSTAFRPRALRARPADRVGRSSAGAAARPARPRPARDRVQARARHLRPLERPRRRPVGRAASPAPRTHHTAPRGSQLPTAPPTEGLCIESRHRSFLPDGKPTAGHTAAAESQHTTLAAAPPTRSAHGRTPAAIRPARPTSDESPLTQKLVTDSDAVQGGPAFAVLLDQKPLGPSRRCRAAHGIPVDHATPEFGVLEWSPGFRLLLEMHPLETAVEPPQDRHDARYLQAPKRTLH